MHTICVCFETIFYKGTYWVQWLSNNLILHPSQTLPLRWIIKFVESTKRGTGLHALWSAARKYSSIWSWPSRISRIWSAAFRAGFIIYETCNIYCYCIAANDLTVWTIIHWFGEAIALPYPVDGLIQSMWSTSVGEAIAIHTPWFKLDCGLQELNILDKSSTSSLHPSKQTRMSCSNAFTHIAYMCMWMLHMYAWMHMYG